MKAIKIAAQTNFVVPQGETTIGEFFEATYLPWAKETLRYSTWSGSARRWKHYLEEHVSDIALTRYRTVDGSRFLTSLAAKRNRNSLAHVRSLLSCIFSHALNLGLVENNPMHDVKVLARVRPPKPKVAYSPAETVAILNAIERIDAKLLFALCAILGMRPSEAAAIRWENIDLDAMQLSVTEAAPGGHLGDTKTEGSKRILMLVPQVASLITQWREKRGGATRGLLFTTNRGGVINSYATYLSDRAVELCSGGCQGGRLGLRFLLIELLRVGGEIEDFGPDLCEHFCCEFRL
jgi:integrase